MVLHRRSSKGHRRERVLDYLKKRLRNEKIFRKFTIPVVTVMVALIAVTLIVSNGGRHGGL